MKSPVEQMEGYLVPTDVPLRYEYAPLYPRRGYNAWQVCCKIEKVFQLFEKTLGTNAISRFEVWMPKPLSKDDYETANVFVHTVSILPSHFSSHVPDLECGHTTHLEGI